MPDKKISALDAIVSVDDADVLPIVDTSVTTTKKINVSQVKALAPVQSVASKTGAVSLVKGDVGLGNVDNTADADKPVSTATQTALDAKQATLVSGTNIKTVNSQSLLGSGDISISSSVAWGGITGTLSSQTDLQSELDGKEDTITGAATTITGTDLTASRALTSSATGKVEVSAVTSTELGYLDGVTSAIQTQIDGKEATITGAATTITSSDLTASRAVTSSATGKIEVSSVTSTELGYVSGVTSAIQTQLDGKQATITGAATTIDDADLTASRALVSDGSGKVAVSDVTSTELGYLDGVTSAVQTQVDAKTAKLITTNRQTASYTLVLSDADKLVEMNVATANNLTIPLNSSVAFATGTQILLAQYGAGQTTVVATSGVTIRSNGGKLKLNVQYSGATLIKIGTDEWYLFGDIVA
jgi:fructose-specific component phosphotransferase system IIB-like protein